MTHKVRLGLKIYSIIVLSYFIIKMFIKAKKPISIASLVMIMIYIVNV
jgi:hypothetical protein